MHFAPGEEQRDMQSAMREVLRRGCPPATVRAVWSGDAQAWEAVATATAAAGLTTVLVAEAHGGLGLDDVDAALLFEEAGAVALPGPAIETCVAAGLLSAAAAESDVAAEWTRRIVEGASVSMTGGPARHGVEVDRCVAVVRLDGDAGVPSPRVAATDDIITRAMPSLDAGRRLFEVEWPEGVGDVVVHGAAAAAASAQAVDRAAVLSAAQAIGAARAMLGMSVEYAAEREQFGRPIGSFQAVKHRLAAAHVLVEVARPVVHRGAYAVAHHEPDRGMRASIAWLHAMRAARTAAETALFTHGAIGYTWDCDLHLWLKRATSIAAAWGNEAWHLRRAGDGMRQHGVPGIAPSAQPAPAPGAAAAG